MRFKLPKPLHGWREFVGEVGIIVIGVLIALAAEQLVDDWNWRNTVKAQRTALDEDVSGMWDSMSARMVVQGCVDKRLNELKVIFQRHDRRLPLGIIGPIGRPVRWNASQDALRMATADGSLSHMQLSEKRSYFSVAGSYDDFYPTATEERASWRLLQILDEPASLTTADWSELRQAYRDAVDTNRVMKYNLVIGSPELWLTAFAKFPRYPPNKDALKLPFVKELCQPAMQH